MENTTLRNITCFVKANRTKPLKIKIKNSTDTLRLKIICYGLNFSKKPYCHAHQCVKNLKKLT